MNLWTYIDPHTTIDHNLARLTHSGHHSKSTLMSIQQIHYTMSLRTNIDPPTTINRNLARLTHSGAVSKLASRELLLSNRLTYTTNQWTNNDTHTSIEGSLDRLMQELAVGSLTANDWWHSIDGGGGRRFAGDGLDGPDGGSGGRRRAPPERGQSGDPARRRRGPTGPERPAGAASGHGETGPLLGPGRRTQPLLSLRRLPQARHGRWPVFSFLLLLLLSFVFHSFSIHSRPTQLRSLLAVVSPRMKWAIEITYNIEKDLQISQDFHRLKMINDIRGALFFFETFLSAFSNRMYGIWLM